MHREIETALRGGMTIEKHEIGDQGDDVVVGASDGHGTAAGLESERPGDGPR